MKFPLIITFLLSSLSLLHANDLTVQINAAYCATAQSGQAIILASGGMEPYTFQWSDPNLEGDEVFDLSPGIYTVTVNDASGCEVAEVFEILENSVIQVSFFQVDISCFGVADGQIVVQDFSPSDLQFSIDGINFSSDLVFENLDAGQYDFFILEGNNCITQEQIFINEPVPLQIELGDDLSIAFGESVQLELLVSAPIPLLSFDWVEETSLSCNDCIDPVATPFETTTYSVVVQDASGCTASDEITINVGEKQGIYIPNVFTPNGDGMNDFFSVYTGGNVAQIKQLLIRDNFGGIVYKLENYTTDFLLGWDGRFRGKKLNPGVFIYQVTTVYGDGSEEETFGTVTLIR